MITLHCFLLIILNVHVFHHCHFYVTYHMDLWKQLQVLYKSLLTSSHSNENLKDKESGDVLVETGHVRPKPKVLLHEDIKNELVDQKQKPVVDRSSDEMFPCEEFTVNISRRNTIPRSRRSNCRRYLNDQMWELRRQSWAGDLHVLTEEEEEEQEQDETKLRSEARLQYDRAKSESDEDLQMDSKQQNQNYSELELYFLTL